MPEDELTYWWARRHIRPMKEDAAESRTANALFYLHQFLPGLFNLKANTRKLSDFLPEWMNRK